MMASEDQTHAALGHLASNEAPTVRRDRDEAGSHSGSIGEVNAMMRANDARLASEMFKKHVRALKVPHAADYDADIEYLGPALVAFADEWAARDLADAEDLALEIDDATRGPNSWRGRTEARLAELHIQSKARQMREDVERRMKGRFSETDAAAVEAVLAELIYELQSRGTE